MSGWTTDEMDFSDLHWERSYGKWKAYGRSKLANLLFAYELQRRIDDAHAGNETDEGLGLRSVACHPGYGHEPPAPHRGGERQPAHEGRDEGRERGPRTGRRDPVVSQGPPACQAAVSGSSVYSVAASTPGDLKPCPAFGPLS